MPIVRTGYYKNKADKYRVWIQPEVKRLPITNPSKISKELFKYFESSSVIKTESALSIGPINLRTNYSFNIEILKAFAPLIANEYFPRIISMGKIKVPKNLSYLNSFEAIVGSLCDESRFPVQEHDPDALLHKFGDN